MLEKSDERRFVKWIKKAIGELLDRWIFLPMGRLFIIEFKRKGEGELLRRQELEIKQLRELGYDVEVHDDAGEAIAAVETRLEATRLYAQGREVHAAKLLRGSLARSRVREDKYKSRRS